MGSVCDVQLAEETFRQSLSLDKLVTRALLCRTELAFLQYSMRRLSSSASWTPELQEHLEVLEELLRRESASAYFEMANLPAVSGRISRDFSSARKTTASTAAGIPALKLRSEGGAWLTCCTTTAVEIGELNGTRPQSIS